MPALRDLQSALIRALLDGDAEDALGAISARGPAPQRRLAVYANTALENLAQSLRIGFPVVRRLVGDAYFDDCVRGYRRAHPPRSGDLHDAGARFPAYLAARHRGGAHRYLGDVARFERLCENARCAADRAPLDLARLAGVAPEDHGRLRFRLHPSARPYASRFPVLAIWQANVDAAAEPAPIDLDRGGDRLLVARSDRGLEFHALDRGELEFLRALRRRARFDDAIAAAARVESAFDAAAVLRRFVAVAAIVDFDIAPAAGDARRAHVASRRDTR